MTHRLFWSTLLAVTLPACGPDLEKVCEDYVDAWGECMDEAFAEDAEALEGAKAQMEGACDEYADVEGDAADAAAEQLQCYSDALAAGDCGDPTAYTTTMLDVAACSSPLF